MYGDSLGLQPLAHLLVLLPAWPLLLSLPALPHRSVSGSFVGLVCVRICFLISSQSEVVKVYQPFLVAYIETWMLCCPM